MTDFFKHGNKVYSENLNDGILVGNSFDWTVSIGLPGDTGGVFPNTTTVVKAKVADCSITPNSNLSIGETITNNAGSSQVYRLTVYPNFNRFGGFTFVSLEGDGSVIIAEKGGTSPVRNNLDYANLGNVTELKTLREYDIVITIPSGGEVTGLGFGFKSSTASANAMISQANVSGLVDALSSLPTKTSDLVNDGADGTNVFVASNDSRLSNARTPTSHTHGQVTNDGKITSSAVTVASGDNIVITDASDSSKLKRVGNVLATHIRDSNAHSNIATSAGATQGAINTAIDSRVGSLSNSITNLGSWSTANFGNATVYYNDYFVYVKITQESNTSTVPTTYRINIDSTYAPPSPLNIPSYTMYNGNPYAFARFNTTGAIEITINRSTYSSSGGVTLLFGVLYPRI